ncbi:MAG: Stage V sporulation protein D [Candidatus Omnitrophica bacterium ADurb.Bin292]|jgi:cell division protein FtsI (penicillin-binding protein 3)|nr:MAG: Stage V sporulation protein D [Candidatus Omnitrophica bacterium ADurb.Bin292]HQB11725.1 penicillin-binding protein 2 [Candidatus Omnitrophota bacterium]
MRARFSQQRFWVLYGALFILFGLIIYQVVQLTYFHQPSLLELAHRQHYVTVDIPPMRGPITDRINREFVTNLKVPSIYAIPRILDLEGRENLTEKLATILKLDKSFVRQRLERDKSFVWLKRRATFEEAEQVQKLNSPAIGMIEEYKRFFPQGSTLANVLGFSNVDNEGLEGIELSMDHFLRGKPGKRITKRDAKGREIRAFEITMLPVVHGSTVVLTIDQHLQYLTEKALETAYTKWKAKAAWAVVMDPKTGELLAIANRPTFDPNEYDRSSTDVRRNRAITDMYEPGSVFKIVAASGALNEGVVTPDSTFFCENGKWNYGVKTLRDVHAYGTLTMEQVIIKSSNIGTVKMALKMKRDQLQDYIRGFGFGALTGVDMKGEAPGYTRPPSQWSKTSPYNIPMGQEVMVTSLQMATAMSVIANGGYLVKPYIVSKVQDPAGVILFENKPTVRRIVIKPETAATMRRILTKAVEEGTGSKAKIPGIAVGGKTGTAQKVLPNGKGYSHSHFMSSFIGFAPGDNPKYVMSVVLDEAHPMYYGGTVAAPVFKEVMESAFLTAGIRPSKMTEAPLPPQDHDLSMTD